MKRTSSSNLRRSNGSNIYVGHEDSQISVYRVYNCHVLVQGADRQYTRVPLLAELTINHATLRLLIQKAHGNKSKKSSDGPLVVRILDSKTGKGGQP
jgi:hypothetical protein